MRYADATARWSAIALGFSIPISVALNNVLLALTLFAWLFSREYQEKLTAFRHPVSVAALALYALLLISAVTVDHQTASAALHLRKYADLLEIPVFLFLFRDSVVRRHAIHALAYSLALVLALSYLIKLGMPVDALFIHGSQANPAVFKKYLTHNILMALGVYLFAWLALSAASRRTQLWWTFLAVLALLNVTIMVHGATGYLILAGLLLLLALRCLGWRGLLTVMGIITVLGAMLMTWTNPFEQRVGRITKELGEWRVNQPAHTSTGERLEFYRNTMAIISEHPLLGVGTGGFATAYAEKTKGTGMVATTNPHNEFLLITAQLGLVGLAALLWLFWRQWRLAAVDTSLESELARGLVVAMVIGCLLNSLLLDHTEGLLYAWLTGVLYGGLKLTGSREASARGAPIPSSSSTSVK